MLLRWSQGNRTVLGMHTSWVSNWHLSVVGLWLLVVSGVWIVGPVGLDELHFLLVDVSIRCRFRFPRDSFSDGEIASLFAREVFFDPLLVSIRCWRFRNS